MNRSLFTDRTLSPNINTSMTSRRPSFNASTFGSPNFIDNTITTEKIINSPFYNGRTIYGGASAYGRRLGRSARDLRTSLKKSVQIKPVNKTNENGNSSRKTARKILDTLEQYSSPVNDAKKIPTTSKRFRPDGYLSQHVGARPYMVRGKDVPSNKELQVPTVSDLLKMKQKMKLQQSTEVVRQIAISSKSNLNNTSGQSTSTTEKDTSETLSKDSSKDQNLETNKATSESQVKTITPSLPVTSLPKFNVAVAPESSKKKSATKTTNGFSFIPTPSISMPFNSQPVVETVKTDVTTKKSDESTTNITNKRSFKFSDPLVISENYKSIVAINNFKFSEPLCKIAKIELPKSLNKDKNNKLCRLQRTKYKSYTCYSKILLWKTIRSSPGTWNCPTCLVKNNDDLLKCAACETAKKENKTSDNLSSLFKVKENEWECKVCMVRNKSSDIKCQCCEATKPGSSSENSTEKDSSKPVLKFNFGFDKVQANTFTFGIPADPAVTLPKPAVDPSTVFGENAKPTAPAAKFSFGIPAESKKEMGTSEAVKPATEVVQAIVPAVDPKVASENKPSKETVTSVDVKLSENIPSPISQKTITKKEEDSTVKPTTTADLNSSIPAKPIFSFGVAPTNSLDKVDATAKEVTKNAPLQSCSASVPNLQSHKRHKALITLLSCQRKPANHRPPCLLSLLPLTKPPMLLRRYLDQQKHQQNNGFGFLNSSFGNGNKASVDAPPKNTAETKPFSFGSTSATGEPANKMPMFSFGPQKSTQPEQSSGFAFGAAKPTGFNFTVGTTETSTFNAPSGNIFSEPATTNSVSFSFGSTSQANGSQKAGFSFGSTMNSTTLPPAASSSFNFAAAAPAPTGGFNFSEAAAGFGSTKPSFNFSDGSVTAFTAAPTTDGAPRKIKRAIRRTQR
ncbi:LOW QUALITY PROTEIN: uncharacterized protein [Leptinotarsa decemlineata]|uniref:LOW QUALITY PROTEIN: uncharacterized protein n=2 Tax=Leptinotarsa decemlineata TaxID=7539 RepID=UPI003D30AE4E